MMRRFRQFGAEIDESRAYSKVSRGGVWYFAIRNITDAEVVDTLSSNTPPVAYHTLTNNPSPGVYTLAGYDNDDVTTKLGSLSDLYSASRIAYPSASIGRLEVPGGGSLMFVADTVDALAPIFDLSVWRSGSAGDKLFAKPVLALFHEGTIDAGSGVEAPLPTAPTPPSPPPSPPSPPAPAEEKANNSTLMALGLVAAGVAAWMIFGRKR